MMVEEIKEALKALSVGERATFYPSFLKTGKGHYVEGDEFIGLSVPDQRKIAKEYFQKISLEELQELLSSKIHEYRLSALLMLVLKFEKTKDPEEPGKIAAFYLQNKKFINNWDLVDTSCYKILGRYCYENDDDSILKSLAEEDHLWSRRIAIVATMFHIKKGQFNLTKELVLKNLNHEHDLMHKANGWLLREMGKKDETELLNFLNLHYKKMPRTSLRYAIEKLDENQRQDYLQSRI